MGCRACEVVEKHASQPRCAFQKGSRRQKIILHWPRSCLEKPRHQLVRVLKHSAACSIIFLQSFSRSSALASDPQTRLRLRRILRRGIGSHETASPLGLCMGAAAERPLLKKRRATVRIRQTVVRFDRALAGLDPGSESPNGALALL